MNSIELEVSAEIVKNEFNRSTVRFHVIAIWVGIGLNLVWFVSDIFVFPALALSFFIFRISISLACALLVVFRKQLKTDIYTCLFALVLGISIQNAYMWSFMDVKHLQQHSAAYMVLFIGAGMLVLWEFKFSIILIVATIISNIAFYIWNSKLSSEEFIINGGLLVFTVSIFSLFLIRTRYRMTFNEIRSRLILAKSKEIIERENKIIVEQSQEITVQKDVLFKKNKEITDSINYAKRIQSAVLPNARSFKSSFKDAFVFFRPKDIVSGDFYWKYETNERLYFAIADCTGHGVPGGFMTILATSVLEQVVRSKKDILPNQMLDEVRDLIVNSLNQGSETEQSKDGMDIIVCSFDKQTHTLHYAAAYNQIILIRNNELLKLATDKQPCGYYEEAKPFSLHSIPVLEGDIYYFTSDGFQDQFGGPKLKKFRSKAIQDLFFEIHQDSFEIQRAKVENTFFSWKADTEQTDDVLVVGVKF